MVKTKVLGSVALAALPCFAQSTAAELLQKGIYAQQTAGDLDQAIAIYRQIVNSAPAQREIAAQAQYLLAESLIRKGDFTLASQEFARLARDYQEFSTVVSRMAAQAPRTITINGAPEGRAGGRGLPPGVTVEQAKQRELELAAASVRLLTAEFDPGKVVTLTGKLSQATWINPRTWLTIETTTGKHTVALAAPNALLQIGLTRDKLKLGEEITVSGIMARDGSPTILANSISSEGKEIFNRSSLPPAPAAAK
jgi:tetratricopeptide (TPR) repeat protein